LPQVFSCSCQVENNLLHARNLSSSGCCGQDVQDIFFDILTLEDTGRYAIPKCGKLSYAAQQPKGAKISTTLWQKPEIRITCTLIHVSLTTSTHLQGHYIKFPQSLIISHQVTHMIHHALSLAYSCAAYWTHCEVYSHAVFILHNVISFSATGSVSDSKAVSCMPAPSRLMHAGNSSHPHICAACI